MWFWHSEIKRKTIHVLGGLLIVAGYLGLEMYWGHRAALMGLVLALILLLAGEFARLELRLMPFLREVLRPDEDARQSSAVPLLVGSIIAFAAFDQNIAIAAVLMITIGDAAANWARARFDKKTKQPGFQLTHADLIEFAVNLMVAFLVLQDWNIALPMALIATVVESFSFKLDDNLTVPIASGFIGQLIIWLLY